MLTGTSAIRTRDNAVLQMTHTEIENLLLLIRAAPAGNLRAVVGGKDALAKA